jgi:PQ loop repeat
VVYSPQIIENYRRKSGEGLSVPFVLIWLTGDLFNVVGAVMAGLIPTVIILGLYVSLLFLVRVLLISIPVFLLRLDFALSNLLLSLDKTTKAGHTA